MEHDRQFGAIRPAGYDIVELAASPQNVLAYAAAMAIAQKEYPGHFGCRKRTEDDAERLLNYRDTTTFAILNPDGAVMGAMSVQVVDGNAVFESLMRSPEIRGLAVGKQLFLQGLQHAQAQGARRIAFDVMAHNPARQLYTALGFEPYNNDDYLDLDGIGGGEFVPMELCGEQAIQDAQDRLRDIIDQQLNPGLQQQIA